MVISRLMCLFSNAPERLVPKAALVKHDSSARKTIILNSLIDIVDEPQVTVLGSTGVVKGASLVQRLKNGGKMEMMPDGSSITRNEDGEIIRTCDQVKCKREFARDPETGELLVRRFGVWSKPANARLDESGTLFFERAGVEIEERINGLHIHTNKASGVSIQTHHHNNFELVKLANGEIWKRETLPDKEVFSMWNHGKLTFRSETYFTSTRTHAQTPSGPQSLAGVSRYEQSWEHGVITREKYTFHNSTTLRKDVNLAVQLGTGMLTLRQVTSVLTTFTDGIPYETTYELKTPSKLRVDIPNKRCQLSDVVRVRNLVAALNVVIAFDTQNGHEYIVFSGTRGLSNRSRAGEAADQLDMLMEEGSMTADLVLR